MATQQGVTEIENSSSPVKSAERPVRFALWPLAILAGAIALLYAPVLQRLVQQWYSDQEYSHGFIVPILSAFVIWKKRHRLQNMPTTQSIVGGVGVVVFSLLLLFVGSLGAELFLSRISLVFMIAGLVLYFSGYPTLRELSFPIGFLLLAIPLPALVYNQIVFPLQLFASQFATGLLDVTHAMPILREGNVLYLPNTTLEVVEACSGIRSLMTLTTLAIGYGYLVEKNIGIRYALALGTIPVAVLANATRVMVTALMSYYVDPSAAEGLTHEFSGIVIFAVATLMMLALHAILVKGHNMILRRAA